MFYKLLIERYTKNPCTIVISTHLIAEAANLIEHCFIIKDGRIIEDSPCEALVSKGYSISGPKSLVDEFIKQKDVIYENNLGGLKTASIKGEVPDEAPEGLEISRLNLQEYFINLVGNNTESGRG
jgi:ABC-2 type transport system ATP-binding protein